MYARFEGQPVISLKDWQMAGLTYRQYKYDVANGDLSVAKHSMNGNTLIFMTSIRRPERLAMIEAKFGPIEREEPKPLFEAKADAEARAWYTAFRKADGTPLEARLIEQYTNRASLLEALKRGLEVQRTERARVGRKVKMGEWYEEAMTWYNEEIGKMGGLQPKSATAGKETFQNARSFERVFKAYCNEGYASVVSGRLGNDSARKVSVKAENLIVALWRTNGKPFKERVWELYMEFVTGDRELYDKETGEVFRPDDFRHKGRTLELSQATVWAYLSQVMNATAVYADRNGNFAYQNTLRPKHMRKLGQYSLSKISMDDVALSRQTWDGKWVYKYMAVDVLSGYWFRPAYVVGKPGHKEVAECFRNMFRELAANGMPMPGELEVEHHLMEDLEWLGSVFPFVRFCASATEKRAEHNIRALKYGAAKDAGHTNGRWYARSEAYSSVRKKVEGDYELGTTEHGCARLTAEQLIADDLADIEAHNNELHKRQKRFAGMTRRDVLMQCVNPELKPIEEWYLLRWIGKQTGTSIVNNNRLQVNGEQFELKDFGCIERLKPNSRKVEAYWNENLEGEVERVYLYQGETYIGEAENMEKWRYNEFACERGADDMAAMLHQQKRVAKFDKMIRERRQQLPKVGGTTEIGGTMVAAEVIETPVEVVETEQPRNYEGDEWESAEIGGTRDWSTLAKESL